ncbi:hypothetical protein [Dyadobacter pollutisoli]|jgi:hypothetical protein|uniref:Uncharacterized protein n=1 Tax=Dyadobacter pollutisoli TaxID=2910158 RepID=A0A9E8N7G1_9BACT|nr:hypothetical protein [Dyadobacter pollutisoli]WAC09327.1 hypothetical protein ON006_16365 [Dyadobacter pollutisoli]
MIRERGEPAIADTSKPIIEPPVFPDYPENTQTTRPVAEDPDLIGDNDDEEDEDLTGDTVVDEFDDDDVEDREVVIEDGDEIIDADDDEDM